MKLRHLVAAPARWGLALRHVFSPPPPGFRAAIFHDTPPSSLPALETLIGHLAARHGICAPSDMPLGPAAHEPTPGRRAAPCLITFDDGFASNLEAARLLARLRVPAVFFVCPGLIGLSAEAQRHAIAEKIHDGRIGSADLDGEKRLLSWDEVREIRSLGHTIGAHGMSHARLPTLAGQSLRDEIGNARTHLEQELTAEIQWYAYSFGDIGSITVEALAEIGADYKYCRSGVRGINARDTHPLALRGDEIDLASPLAYQKFTLEGGLDYRYQEARKILDGFV